MNSVDEQKKKFYEAASKICDEGLVDTFIDKIGQIDGDLLQGKAKELHQQAAEQVSEQGEQAQQQMQALSMEITDEGRQQAEWAAEEAGKGGDVLLQKMSLVAQDFHTEDAANDGAESCQLFSAQQGRDLIAQVADSEALKQGQQIIGQVENRVSQFADSSSEAMQQGEEVAGQVVEVAGPVVQATASRVSDTLDQASEGLSKMGLDSNTLDQCEEAALTVLNGLVRNFLHSSVAQML